MEASPINPGMGDDLNSVLSRLSAIELELSKFQVIRFEAAVVGEGTQILQVLALREGAVDGADFDLELLNSSVTETGGETYTFAIPWPDGKPRKLYVRGSSIKLIDPGGPAVDRYEVISRMQGEDFSVNPVNQTGPGLEVVETEE